MSKQNTKRYIAAISRPYNIRKIIGSYTALFILCVFFVLLPYAVAGTSLVSNADAYYQHFPALSYYGQYLRKILTNLFVEHKVSIPTWDLSLGYGSDILTTLHYYCLGEPLTLLSAFFSEETTEICYALLIILRWYLSGLSFLLYCRTLNIPGYSTICGAIIYALSGYALAPGVYHPFFGIPMIYFPLLLMGAEKIYREENPSLFIFATAFAAVSNVYFFYMMVLLLVVYLILRYFSYFTPFRLGECILWILKFTGYAMISLMIASPIFAPNLLSILHSDRIGSSHTIPIFYPLDYYKHILAAFLSIYEGYYLYISTGALGVVAVMSILSSHSRTSGILKKTFFICFIMILFPVFGSIMNGGAYATNRWIWGFILLISVGVAVCLPTIETLPASNLSKILLFSILLGILAIILDGESNIHLSLSVIILFLVAFFILLHSRRKISSKFLRFIFVATAVLTVICNGLFWASPLGYDWANNSSPLGYCHEYHLSPVFEEIATYGDSDRCRIDYAKNTVAENAPMYQNLNGTSFYFSSANQGATSIQRSLLLNSPMEQRYSGLDHRAYLEAAFGVSYYCTYKDTEQALPYCYDTVISQGDFTIYAGENVVPLVYAFDEVSTNSQNMSPLERQQALLQCAMVDEHYGLPEAELQFCDQVLDYQLSPSENVCIEGKKIVVSEPNSALTLTFSPEKDAELYLLLEGIDCTTDDEHTTIQVPITAGSFKETFQYLTPSDNFYCGVHDFLVHLGYEAGESGEIVINFQYPGVYTFSKLLIAIQPLEHLSSQIEQLRNSGISDINIHDGCISFTTQRETDGIVCAAVPYQPGWTASVDQKQVEVISVQNGFCGILLPQGSHRVVLEYHTPFLKMYSLCSFVGVILLIIFSIYHYSVTKGKVQQKKFS